ncbi:phosphoribosylanthranilate isomerase [Coprococcus sp. OM04-5BH]|uniref:phosphoribosylanthranilate isomerase n=1 Tax=Coprococcus sp. OM04-5BH TaxID=2293093 RepID=UPI000E543BD9|nr:phosphoribosylanthranilate isomerase [Coprococcus sp. OM04-5BH]RHV33950.1 phosphoribosylanthranilate isomerase [Coprococcus sp. OM04-5BH]
MTRIKLCGLTRIQDIEIANKLKPEYIGFIFWDRSSRNVSAIQAARLKGKLDSEIKTVGVFVNAPAEQVISYYNVGIIDIAQLHGNENEEYIKKLHDAGLTVIKAFKMKKTGENINLAGNANIETPEKPTGNAITETSEKSTDDVITEAVKSSADYIMFDPGKGEGATFNWQLIKGIKREFFLAGGLTPENIEKAVETVQPFAVDVSSGIETDGHKDPDKMSAFVKSTRAL